MPPIPPCRKIVEIKRDEIKLKEQEAKAEIIERPQPDGTTARLGWITLPSFYADMEHSGAPRAKSTTKDVLALLNRLKAGRASPAWSWICAATAAVRSRKP